MINILVVDGDMQIVVNENTTDFVQLEKDKNIVEQNISHHVSLIRGTYDIRPSLGIPWLGYLNRLNNQDADNLMLSYLYDRVMNYPGIVPSSVLVELKTKENRNVYFTITATYDEDQDIEINIERSLSNVT